jgi:hypothetical protein
MAAADMDRAVAGTHSIGGAIRRKSPSWLVAIRDACTDDERARYAELINESLSRLGEYLKTLLRERAAEPDVNPLQPNVIAILERLESKKMMLRAVWDKTLPPQVVMLHDRRAEGEPVERTQPDDGQEQSAVSTSRIKTWYTSGLETWSDTQRFRYNMIMLV